MKATAALLFLGGCSYLLPPTPAVESKKPLRCNAVVPAVDMVVAAAFLASAVVLFAVVDWDGPGDELGAIGSSVLAVGYGTSGLVGFARHNGCVERRRQRAEGLGSTD